jgi:protease I
MAGKLDGKRIAFIAADGVEQIELTEPWKAVEQEGGKPELISLESGEIQGFNHLDTGDTFRVDKAIDDANPDDYDNVVLPGGVANPDFLRTNEKVVSFIRDFFRRASRWRPSATVPGRLSRPAWLTC